LPSSASASSCTSQPSSPISYFFLNFFIDNSVLAFILIMIVNSVDFWVIKNISGRLLVGLMWFYQINEDGSEVWIFESMDSSWKPNLVDSTFFWAPQVSSFLFYTLAFIFKLITLHLFWVPPLFVPHPRPC